MKAWRDDQMTGTTADLISSCSHSGGTMRRSASLLVSGILLLALQAVDANPAFSQDPPDVAMGMIPLST